MGSDPEPQGAGTVLGLTALLETGDPRADLVLTQDATAVGGRWAGWPPGTLALPSPLGGPGDEEQPPFLMGSLPRARLLLFLVVPMSPFGITPFLRVVPVETGQGQGLGDKWEIHVLRCGDETL